MFSKSINRRLMMLFFVVGVSSLSAVGIYAYFKAKNALLNRTLDQLTSIRVIKKGQIETFFYDKIEKVGHLSENEYVNTVLSVFIEHQQHDTTIGIGETTSSGMLPYDSDIIFIYGTDSLNLQIYQLHNLKAFPIIIDSINHAQLIKLWEGCINTHEVKLVDFQRCEKTGVISQCYIGKQLLNENSRQFCVVAVQISIDDINKIMSALNPQNGLGMSGEVYLVGDDYLMRSESMFIPNSVLITSVKTMSVSDAFKNEHGSSLIDDYRTISCLSSYQRLDIPGLKWAILAEIDYSEAMIPIMSIRNDIVFISVVICVFLFSISHIISKTITKPIVKLKDITLRIGEGDLDIRLKPKRADEIGMLYLAFNNMAEQLKEEHQKRMTALYDGQELERQRISRELHDGLGQKLVAIKLQLESTSKHDLDETRAVLQDVKEGFLRAIEEVKQISNNLAPNVIKESGLDTAMKDLCASVRKMTCTKIDFSTYGEITIDDPKARTYLFRIAQEAITNAIKHAKPGKIEVQLYGNKDSIILIVEDNGSGFMLEPEYFRKGNGLLNIKERAKLLDGSLAIETEIGLGTTIRVKVPKAKHII